MKKILLALCAVFIMTHSTIQPWFGMETMRSLFSRYKKPALVIGGALAASALVYNWVKGYFSFGKKSKSADDTNPTAPITKEETPIHKETQTSQPPVMQAPATEINKQEGIKDRASEIITKNPERNESISTFHNWNQACTKLPSYSSKPNPYQTCITQRDMEQEIELFQETMQQQFTTMTWVDNTNPYRPLVTQEQFGTYVEKMILPNDAIIAFHGDLHGDVHSLNRMLNHYAQQGYMDAQDPFKIINKNFYIILLGDYVDRGWYGTETIYTILRLKNSNPDRVFMVRGNHEERSIYTFYGFGDELRKKFGIGSARLKYLCDQVYNLLPAALYVGSRDSKGHTHYIQCCHGGIEVGFDPKQLLAHKHPHAGVQLKKLMQQDGFQSIGLVKGKNHIPLEADNGFMWGDFTVSPESQEIKTGRNTKYAYEFGHKPTTLWLDGLKTESYTVQSIFRAHQHADMTMHFRIMNLDNLSHEDDKGLGKLWITQKHKKTPSLLTDCKVVTFSVAPDTSYNELYNIHVFGELHMADTFEGWRLYTKNMSKPMLSASEVKH